MTNEEYWFWLGNINDLWQNDIKKLLDGLGTPENIYDAGKVDLIGLGKMNTQQAERIAASRGSAGIWNRFERVKKDGILFIHPGHDQYPERFSVLKDMPYTIYVKGAFPDTCVPSVGVVGARACTGYGREMASKISTAVSLSGGQVISGMAVGIDSLAARAAITAGGKTFAVLGSGVDVIYPRESIDLYYSIIMNGGGIISEYPLGTRPWPWQFPHRNRLISALSDKLVIIEAARHSGTLSTAGHALDQGVDIYALPGRLGDKLSEGCNSLISDGAGILLSPEEFVDTVWADFKAPFPAAVENRAMSAEGTNEPLDNEKDPKVRVLKAVGYTPVSFKSIREMACLETGALSELISLLELEGLIRQISADYYVRSQ